jgi:hypothetical protein
MEPDFGWITGDGYQIEFSFSLTALFHFNELAMKAMCFSYRDLVSVNVLGVIGSVWKASYSQLVIRPNFADWRIC